MKKKINLIALTLIILSVFTIILVSCKKAETFKQTPIKGDSVENTTLNNGGYVIERGNFIYFVDGNIKISELKKGDNKFGIAKRGALYRIEKENLKNNDLSKAQRIIPLMIYDTDVKYGITVIGDWFYYTTPYTDEQVDQKYVKFSRTKLDGSLTQTIAVYQTVSSEKVPQHKFIKNGLYVVENNKLILHKYSDDKISNDKNSKVIVTSNLSQAILPILDSNSKSIYTNGVIYLESYPSNDKDGKKIDKVSNNKIFYFDGSKSTAILEGNDKTEFSLLTYSEKDSKVTIYVNRSELNNSSKTGLYTFVEKDAENLKLLSINEIKNKDDVYPVSSEEGIYLVEQNTIYKVLNGEKKAITIELSKKPAIIAIKDGNMFYKIDNKLMVFNLSNSDPAKLLTTDTLSESLLPEFVGDNIYYFDKENNIKYINLNDALNSDKAKEGKSIQINQPAPKEDKNNKK